MNTKKDTPYSRLLNEGPKTLDEMGIKDFTPEMRADGLTGFNVTDGPGAGLSTGNTESVYYIADKHSPRSVLEKWAEVNDELLEGANKWSVHLKICSNRGKEWKEASGDVFGPFEVMEDSGGAHEQGGECPRCGEVYYRYLADHLPECDA